jgi:hypothetical protein
MYVYTALFSRSTQMLTLNSNLSFVNIITIGIQGTLLTDLFFSVALIYFIVDNSTFSLQLIMEIPYEQHYLHQNTRHPVFTIL